MNVNPAKIFTNGDWMLSQSRTTSLERGDLVVFGTAKPGAQKEHFIAHNARKRCIKKGFDGIHDNFQRDPVHRDSQLKKLAGPRTSASQWINWHRKTTPTAYPMRNMRDIRKMVSHTEQIGQECNDETPIRLPNSSHINEPSPPRIRRRTTRTNPFSSIPKVAFVFFFQYLMVAVC